MKTFQLLIQKRAVHKGSFSGQVTKWIETESDTLGNASNKVLSDSRFVNYELSMGWPKKSELTHRKAIIL